MLIAYSLLSHSVSSLVKLLLLLLLFILQVKSEGYNMSSESKSSLPKPKILNCLRIFYALYFPIATIALAISIFLCLPLYNSILLGFSDPTQIGYNDMDSKLFSRQVNVILLVTHHSLYLLQIIIGIIGLFSPFGQIFIWIIYVLLAVINGFFLLIFTLSGLVFFALPVIFSIIDISNSCYMCFILEAYSKNNLIYQKSLVQEMQSRISKDTSSQVDNKIHSSAINSLDIENGKETLDITNEALEQQMKSNQLNYVTCEAKLRSSNETKMNQCTIYGANSSVHLNGRQFTSLDEQIELEERAKLPSSKSYNGTNEIVASLLRTRDCDIEPTNVQHCKEKTSKGATEITFHDLHGTTKSLNNGIKHGTSEEFLSLSSNDLYFSSSPSLESVNKIHCQEKELLKSTNLTKPEAHVINSFVKDAVPSTVTSTVASTTV